MVQTTVDRKSFQPSKEEALVLWFEDVGITDIPLVGGKNASLGEMIQQLTPKGVNVPTGFATTAYAYRYFVAYGYVLTMLISISLVNDEYVLFRPFGPGSGSMVLKLLPHGFLTWLTAKLGVKVLRF